MLTLIKNGMVLTLDPQDWLLPRADILVEDGVIKAVGQPLVGYERVEHVVDADQKLVMPGWVNADLHASEVMFKGRFENTPLDQRPYYTEMLGCENPEVVYASALFSGLAMIKSGVTTIQDHWLFPLATSLKQVEAVIMAYQTLGLRTTLAIGSCDGYLEERYALVLNDLPPALWERENGKPLDPNQWVNALHRAVELWHQKPGTLLRLAIAPRLRMLDDPGIRREILSLTDQHRLGLHFHFDETKMHALSRNGQKTFTQAAEEMGLLSERTSIAHAAWITPEDMDLLAKHRSVFVHTPLSDLYSGSGILPVHQLTERGIPLAIGFGAGSGGAQNFFDALKMVASIQRIVQPDYAKWPNVKQLLAMGVAAGAQASLWNDQVGRVTPGNQADLVFYDLKKLPFTPLNELEFQLIYLEDSSSIDSVMVNGKFLMQNGKVLSVDEDEVLDRFMAAQAKYDHQRETWDLSESRIAPYKLSAFRKSLGQSYPVHRWANQAPLASKLKETFPHEVDQHVDTD